MTRTVDEAVSEAQSKMAEIISSLEREIGPDNEVSLVKVERHVVRNRSGERHQYLERVKLCLVNHAKPEGQQQPDSSEGSKDQLRVPLNESDKFGNVKNFQHSDQVAQLGLPRMSKEDRLILALERQSKTLEGYTASNLEIARSNHNLAQHIALLIQAMADGEDETGTGPDTRTLG